MKIRVIKLTYHHIKTFMVGCLFFFTTIYLTKNEYAKEASLALISGLLILLSLGFIYPLLYRLKINRYLFPTLATSLIFLLYCFINYLYFYPTWAGFGRLAQAFLLLTFMLKTSLTKWDSTDLKILNLMTFVFFVVCLNLWIISDYQLQFRAYFFNPNSYGSIIFLILYFPLAVYLYPKKLFTLLSISLGIVLLYSSSNRSSWLALASVLGTYYAWGFITKTRFRHQLFIWLLFLCFFAFLELYANYAASSSFEYKRLVLSYTGKAIDSGRQILWPIYMDAFHQNPIFGLGISQGIVEGADLVAHNLYLALLMQTGIVGLVIFCILLSQIWSVFRLNAGNKYIRLGASFFIGGLVHENFEVTLIQGNIVISMFFWLIVGITLSFCLQGLSEARNSIRG